MRIIRIQISVFFLCLSCSLYFSSVTSPSSDSNIKGSFQPKLAVSVIPTKLGKMKNVAFRSDTQARLITSRSLWLNHIIKNNLHYIDVLGDEPGSDFMNGYRSLNKKNLIEIEVTREVRDNFSTLIWFFTGGILPSYKVNVFNFNSNIYDKNGKLVSLELFKTYEVSEYSSFLFLPLWLFNGNKRYDQILSYMVENYLIEIDDRLRDSEIPLEDYDISNRIVYNTMFVNLQYLECNYQIYLFSSPRYNSKLMASPFSSVCSLEIKFLNNSSKQMDLDISKSQLYLSKGKISPMVSGNRRDDSQVNGVWISSNQEISLNVQNFHSFAPGEIKSLRLFYSIPIGENPSSWELIDQDVRLSLDLSE